MTSLSEFFNRYRFTVPYIGGVLYASYVVTIFQLVGLLR